MKLCSFAILLTQCLPLYDASSRRQSRRSAATEHSSSCWTQLRNSNYSSSILSKYTENDLVQLCRTYEIWQQFTSEYSSSLHETNTIQFTPRQAKWLAQIAWCSKGRRQKQESDLTTTTTTTEANQAVGSESSTNHEQQFTTAPMISSNLLQTSSAEQIERFQRGEIPQTELHQPPTVPLPQEESHMDMMQQPIVRRQRSFGDFTDTSTTTIESKIILVSDNNLIECSSHHGPTYRKELRMLTDLERKSFLSAVKQLKVDLIDGVSKFDLLLRKHIMAIASSKNAMHVGYYEEQVYREQLHELETALREQGYMLSLPYWDISLEDSLTSSDDKSSFWRLLENQDDHEFSITSVLEYRLIKLLDNYTSEVTNDNAHLTLISTQFLVDELLKTCASTDLGVLQAFLDYLIQYDKGSTCQATRAHIGSTPADQRQHSYYQARPICNVLRPHCDSEFLTCQKPQYRCTAKLVECKPSEDPKNSEQSNSDENKNWSNNEDQLPVVTSTQVQMLIVNTTVSTEALTTPSTVLYGETNQNGTTTTTTSLENVTITTVNNGSLDDNNTTTSRASVENATSTSSTSTIASSRSEDDYELDNEIIIETSSGDTSTERITAKHYATGQLLSEASSYEVRGRNKTKSTSSKSRQRSRERPIAIAEHSSKSHTKQSSIPIVWFTVSVLRINGFRKTSVSGATVMTRGLNIPEGYNQLLQGKLESGTVYPHYVGAAVAAARSPENRKFAVSEFEVFVKDEKGSRCEPMCFTTFRQYVPCSGRIRLSMNTYYSDPIPFKPTEAEALETMWNSQLPGNYRTRIPNYLMFKCS